MRHNQQRRNSGRGGWHNDGQRGGGGGGGGGDRRGGGPGGDRSNQYGRDRGGYGQQNPRQAPSHNNLNSTPATPMSQLSPPPKTTPDVSLHFEENTTFFYWEFLTDSRLQTWDSIGEDQVLEEAINIHNEGDYSRLAVLMHEILHASISYNRLSTSRAAKLLLSIVDSTTAHTTISENVPSSESTAELLVTAFSMMEDAASSPKLLDLVRALMDFKSPLLPAEMFLSILESPTLVSLDLVSQVFPRKTIRVFTNLVYRQQKYNLLREESEGYSKLVTELFTSSYAQHPLPLVKSTVDNVTALVGAFDLDPGRVLDVLLDTFACTIVANCRFFVNVLREGPWWPANHTGKCRIDQNSFFSRVHELAAEEDGNDVQGFYRAIMGTEPYGNKVAAQLLGFKYRYYQRPDVTEQTPDNLICLCALLIKIGFIKLTDLWPHLGPNADKPDRKPGEEEEGEIGSEEEEYMRGIHEKWQKGLAEKAGKGKLNALMMAGALSDDTPSSNPSHSFNARADSSTAPVKPNEPSEDKKAPEIPPKEVVDQKLPLLRHLLAIGAIPEALFILGKYEWIGGPEPTIADHIHRIVHHSIEEVYNQSKQAMRLPTTINGHAKPVTEGASNVSSVLPGSTKLLDRPKRKVTRTLGTNWSRTQTDDVEFRYFWDDWTDGVPICQSVEDVLVLCRTFLRYSGVRIARDPSLMTKICRIGRNDIGQALKTHDLKVKKPSPRPNSGAEDDDTVMDTDHVDQTTLDQADQELSECMDKWAAILRELLLPAITLTGSNPGLVSEVWALLKHFKAEARYRLYGDWLYVHCKYNTELKFKTMESDKETKDLLKRISKTNVRQMARALAKVAMHSPGTVFNVILNQIEAYDNLADVVVDAAKYFTVLGYDVLVWCICTQLAQNAENAGGRKDDGMGRRKWLNGKCLSLDRSL